MTHNEAAKKRRSDVDEKQQMWLSLAKLYKNLGEEDILRFLINDFLLIEIEDYLKKK